MLALGLAAATALAVVATNLAGSGSEVPIASAEVLERAAAAAERKPLTPPRDHQWNPLKAGNPEGRVTKGSQVVSERITTAIVDKPGERP